MSSYYPEISSYQSGGKIAFSKMQGCGNHFILAAATFEFASTLDFRITQKICDPHFGIGADGVFLIYHLTENVKCNADFGVFMYNPDGSSMGMCGNGIRCVADFIDRYLDKSGKLSKKSVSILVDNETTIECQKFDGQMIKVQMGKGVVTHEGSITLNSKDVFKYQAVLVPNPHAIIQCDNLPTYEQLRDFGPEIENHKNFPNRTNVEFVKILDKYTVEVLVWERAAGMTQACGTGACATVLSLFKKGLINAECEVRLPGGKLLVEVRSSDGVDYLALIGPQKEVFVGQVDLSSFNF